MWIDILLSPGMCALVRIHRCRKLATVSCTNVCMKWTQWQGQNTIVSITPRDQLARRTNRQHFHFALHFGFMHSQRGKCRQVSSLVLCAVAGHSILTVQPAVVQVSMWIHTVIMFRRLPPSLKRVHLLYMGASLCLVLSSSIDAIGWAWGTAKKSDPSNPYISLPVEYMQTICSIPFDA